MNLDSERRIFSWFMWKKVDMKSIVLHKTIRISLVTSLALVLLGVTWVFGRASANDGTIYACVLKSGLLRIVSSPGSCTKFERLLSWNIMGLQGPKGDPGLTGNDGATGTTGPAGQACWDLNGNGTGDLPVEDTNLDGVVDVNDCRGSSASVDDEAAARIASDNSIMSWIAIHQQEIEGIRRYVHRGTIRDQLEHMDLESERISFVDNYGEIWVPLEADFYLGLNGPDMILVQENGAEVAFLPDEDFDFPFNYHTLTFSSAVTLTPFTENDVFVIKTADGNYFKIGRITHIPASEYFTFYYSPIP
jgi:hypothetical protein